MSRTNRDSIKIPRQLCGTAQQTHAPTPRSSIKLSLARPKASEGQVLWSVAGNGLARAIGGVMMGLFECKQPFVKGPAFSIPRFARNPPGIGLAGDTTVEFGKLHTRHYTIMIEIDVLSTSFFKATS